MVKITPLPGSFKISSSDSIVQRTKKIPKKEDKKVTIKSLVPEWHNVQSRHEYQHMNIRDSCQELCRSELGHILSKGVEILQRCHEMRDQKFSNLIIKTTWRLDSNSLFSTGKFFLSVPSMEKVAKG